MKKHKDLWMLPVILLSLLLSNALFTGMLQIIDISFLYINDFVRSFLSYFTFVSPVIPFVFVQLYLCRNAKYTWIPWIPVCLILGIAFLLFLGFSFASGWDSLGYAILLVFCIPPVVGCILGAAVYMLTKKISSKS